MILVVGATGSLGSEICKRLLAERKSVRAMVRASSDPAKVAELKQLDAEIVEAELKEPVSLHKACDGVTAVISTASACPAPHQASDTIPTVDQAGQLSLVDAAKAAGVSHFVYVSYSRNIATPSPLTTAKRTVEKHLISSGLTYTILRPTYFMEVWLSAALGFDFANAKVQVYGTGKNKLSFISLVDVAHFAVAALDNPRAHNAMLELGGPEALSVLEVVRLYEQAEGRHFLLTYIPESDLETQRQQAVDPLLKTFAALQIDFSHGDTIDMKSVLKTFPVKLTSVQDYIQHSVSIR